jgi:hypothetical protein
MGIFSKVQEVSMQSDRRAFPERVGVYVIELEKTSVVKSPKTKKYLAIVEFTVRKVVEGVEGEAHRLNEQLVTMWDVTTNSEGDYTEAAEYGVKRLKAFVRNALGGAYQGIEEDAITSELMEGIFGEPGKGGSETLKGVLMEMQIKAGVKPAKNGTLYPTVTFLALPPSDSLPF